MKIPGVSFSLKRALGITKLKRRFTKATGIPTTKTGVEQKVGASCHRLDFWKEEMRVGENNDRILVNWSIGQ